MVKKKPKARVRVFSGFRVWGFRVSGFQGLGFGRQGFRAFGVSGLVALKGFRAFSPVNGVRRTVWVWGFALRLSRECSFRFSGLKGL